MSLVTNACSVGKQKTVYNVAGGVFGWGGGGLINVGTHHVIKGESGEFGAKVVSKGQVLLAFGVPRQLGWLECPTEMFPDDLLPRRDFGVV